MDTTGYRRELARHLDAASSTAADRLGTIGDAATEQTGVTVDVVLDTVTDWLEPPIGLPRTPTAH